MRLLCSRRHCGDCSKEGAPFSFLLPKAHRLRRTDGRTDGRGRSDTARSSGRMRKSERGRKEGREEISGKRWARNLRLSLQLASCELGRGLGKIKKTIIVCVLSAGVTKSFFISVIRSPIGTDERLEDYEESFESVASSANRPKVGAHLFRRARVYLDPGSLSRTTWL